MISPPLPQTFSPLVREASIDDLVVGLDVLATGEPAADHLLAEIVPLLHSHGAENLLAATHCVMTFDKPHVAMSISFTGRLGRALALELLADALAGGDGAAGAVWTADGGPDGVGTGLPSLQQSARSAATAHRNRSSGRVVHFPGIENLTGPVSFQAVLLTGVDRIDPCDGALPPAQALLRFDGSVRPHWRGGELVLCVQQVGAVWMPVEAPGPCSARL